PFNIPVSAEETCRSANGNKLKGNASQNTPSATIFGQSDRNTGFRADGNSDSVKNPITSRTSVTPPGPIAPSESTINRYEAPQIIPGSERTTHSAAPGLCAVPFALELASFAIRCLMNNRIDSSLADAKCHFGESNRTTPRGNTKFQEKLAANVSVRL